MPKGYWIGNSDWTDLSVLPAYAKANRPVLERYGARFLVRGGAVEVVEGTGRSRVTTIEFPSYEAALACYHDPEYQSAAALRHAASEGLMVIAEGFDAP